jgi:hypothetical protein
LSRHRTSAPGRITSRIVRSLLIHLLVGRIVRIVLVVRAGPDAPERHASNEGDDHGDETREGKHLSIRYRRASWAALARHTWPMT